VGRETAESAEFRVRLSKGDCVALLIRTAGAGNKTGLVMLVTVRVPEAVGLPSVKHCMPRKTVGAAVAP